jgi:hypothetical protein
MAQDDPTAGFAAPLVENLWTSSNDLFLPAGFSSLAVDQPLRSHSIEQRLSSRTASLRGASIPQPAPQISSSPWDIPSPIQAMPLRYSDAVLPLPQPFPFSPNHPTPPVPLLPTPPKPQQTSDPILGAKKPPKSHATFEPAPFFETAPAAPQGTKKKKAAAAAAVPSLTAVPSPLPAHHVPIPSIPTAPAPQGPALHALTPVHHFAVSGPGLGTDDPSHWMASPPAAEAHKPYKPGIPAGHASPQPPHAKAKPAFNAAQLRAVATTMSNIREGLTHFCPIALSQDGHQTLEFQRLEFLGDSYLAFTLTLQMFDTPLMRFASPHMLTVMRTSMVKNEHLADTFRALELNKVLPAVINQKTMADVVEAAIGELTKGGHAEALALREDLISLIATLSFRI